MSEKKKKSIRGIRIRTVSYVMIFLSIVLYLILFFANNKVSKEYEVAVISTEDYGWIQLFNPADTALRDDRKP